MCRHIRRGRDGGRDQGHHKARASPEQVEIEMEYKRRKPPEEV